MANEPVVHDFHEQLEWSANLSDEQSWDAFYRQVWSDVLTTTRLDGKSDWQHRGVDRVVFRAAGQQHFIDEKKRRGTWNDVLLEVWSVCEFDWEAKRVVGDRARRKPGWAVDRGKHCDFIAYAVPELHQCYLLPFELLRLSMEHCLSTWKRDEQCKYPVAARNDGYATVSIAVPWGLLKENLTSEMLRSF